jgi:hypothetical protein
MQRSTFLTGLCGAALALLGVELLGQQPAASETPTSAMRYQVSSYGSQAGTGAFVVDTQTGRVWKVNDFEPPTVVAELGSE